MLIINKIIKISILVSFLLYPISTYSKNYEKIGSLNGIISKNDKYIQYDVIAKSNTDIEFNTIDLQLHFDKTKLNLVKIKDEYSFCNIILINKINNKKGNFTMQCGAFGYNASNESKIISLIFKQIDTGIAEINFNDSRLLANDGYGTDILSYTETNFIYLEK